MEKLTDEERRKKSREGRMFDRSVHQQSIERTMIKAEQAVPDKPCIPSKKVRLLRAMLILEEALETVRALGFEIKSKPLKAFYDDSGTLQLPDDVFDPKFENRYEPNLVEIADGCADLSVVTIGTLSACGISDIPILQEVDRANWEKVKDGLIKREDGKYLKPEGWKPPDIEGQLKEMGLDG